jgi:solute:Na+ symporter, SSS family
LFIIETMPPLIGGIILATLLVALVGTGAGLSLGISTVFYNDLYKIYFKKKHDDKKALLIARAAIVVILICAALLSFGDAGGLILSWSFMSMGLRGSVAFGPMSAALFFPGKIPKIYAIIAIIAGPLFTLIGKFLLPASIDSLFLGIACSLLVLLIGYFVGTKQRLKKASGAESLPDIVSKDVNDHNF